MVESKLFGGWERAGWYLNEERVCVGGTDGTRLLVELVTGESAGSMFSRRVVFAGG